MIRFENVSMQYDDDPEIFSDINFNLPQGSFTFLTGPSGAGKTSLLRLIFLAAQPSRGKVFYLMKTPAHWRARISLYCAVKLALFFKSSACLNI